MKLLSRFYPNHKWDKAKLSNTQKRSSQWWLYKTLQEIFPPGVGILEEYQLSSRRKLPISMQGNMMIFDIFVPSLNIVFEYHGYQHYYDHYMFGDVKSLQDSDNDRRVLCANHNMSYIAVPYWWKRDKESILAIMHQVRPDLVAESPVATPFNYQIKTKPSKELRIIMI